MEETERADAQGDSTEMRSERMQGNGNSPDGQEGVSGRVALEVQHALGLMTAREQAVFDAGMKYGATIAYQQAAVQFSGAASALERTSAGNATNLRKALDAIPAAETKATKVGVQAGRRVKRAIQALLGSL